MATMEVNVGNVCEFRPSCCHVSDTSNAVASNTHVYMYRSMVWYKREKGDGGSPMKTEII